MLDSYILHEIIKNGYQQFDRSSTLKTLLSLYTSGGGSPLTHFILSDLFKLWISIILRPPLSLSLIICVLLIFSPLLSQRKSYSRVLISLSAPWCVGREVKTCTIWDTAKAFMIVILPRAVSLLADQLFRMFFTLSIFLKKIASPEHTKTLYRQCKMRWKIWSYAMFGEFLIQMARGLSGGKDNQIFIADLISF